jgi:hypothetical protein
MAIYPTQPKVSGHWFLPEERPEGDFPDASDWAQDKMGEEAFSYLLGGTAGERVAAITDCGMTLAEGAEVGAKGIGAIIRARKRREAWISGDFSGEFDPEPAEPDNVSRVVK